MSDTESEGSSVKSEASIAPSSDDPSSNYKPPSRKKRRESVCAEKIRDDVCDSELKVIEKSDEEAARILQILEKNVFFSHLDGHQMKKIQNSMFLVEKEDGDIVINQGDDGDNFYIIDSGSVDVFINESNETTDRHLVKTCEAGDAFGELAIMYNAPRAASCVANGHVRLWALDRVSFKVILMQTTIAKRNAYKGFLQNVPVFSQLTEYEILTIADALQEETFDDNAVICSQDESGDKFYLVKEGTAICTKYFGEGSNMEVARLTSGTYFGEVRVTRHKGLNESCFVF